MRLRLLLAFTILIIITLVGTSLFIRQQTSDQIRQFVRRGGEVNINTAVDELEAYYAANQTWVGASTILEKNGLTGNGSGPGKGAQGRSGFHLTDAGGLVISDNTNTANNEVLSQHDLDQGVALIVNNKTVGYLILPGSQAASNNNLEQALLSELDHALTHAALLSGLVALILALLLSTAFVKPIRQLTKAASSLTKDNLDERVEVKGPQELKTLAKTFNHMAEELQAAEHNRKAMTADIAHELRTPLSVQKVNLEALQDGVYPLTLESLQPILEQNELLTHLVQDLRTLSLAEAGEIPLEMSRFDVQSVLQSLTTQFEKQARQREIQLHIEPQANAVYAYADRTRILQILSNLLQNALRYTPAGSHVYLSAAVEGRHACIKVRDTGPGINAEALPYVFERFYKADKSRSRDETGSGLGLAIARQLAALNGGDLTAANHRDGGAVFTLTLPLAPENS